MKALSKSEFAEWKKKRLKTLLAFSFIGFTIGIDGSVVFTTLYLYLRDTVQTRHPQTWYGVIVAFFFISSSISGTICGRWVDRTRNIRAYVNMALLVQIFGFIFYSMPYHGSVILIGRTLCGMSDPFINVISGEVFRIYDQKDSTKWTLWIASAYSVGFVTGPSLNFLSKGVRFKIGPIVINELNFIALFMIGLLTVMIVVANLLAHDCSKEFDLKEHSKFNPNNVTGINDPISDNNNPIFDLDSRKSIKENMTDISTIKTPNQDLPHDMESKLFYNAITGPAESSSEFLSVKEVCERLAHNKDILLIIITTFVFVYTLFTADALLPLLVTITLQWGLKALSFVYAGFGISYLLYLFLMSKICTTNRSIYIASLVAIPSQCVMCVLLILLKMCERNTERDVAMVSLFLLVTSVGWSFDDVLLRVMLANMVPSSVQSFSETVRSAATKIAMVIGSLTAGTVLPWIHVWSVAMGVCTALFLVAFLLRYKQLVDPKEISFSKCDQRLCDVGDNMGMNNIIGTKKSTNVTKAEFRTYEVVANERTPIVNSRC